jgi:hypothetical protein
MMRVALERLFLRCRAAGDKRMRPNRSNDGCSCRDISPFSNDCMWNNGRARSDKAIASADDLSSEIAARGNLDVVFDDVVVINDDASIDDGKASDYRSWIYDGPCHHNRAMTDLRIGGDHGGRMNKYGELAAGRQDCFGDGPPDTGIADGDNKSMRRSQSRDGFCYRPFDVDIRWSGTWVVVDEAGDGFSDGPRNVRNYPPMGAAPDDFYGPL